MINNVKTFDDMIKLNHHLMLNNKFVSLIDRGHEFRIEDISLDTIEDPDTLGNLDKLVEANRFLISYDSQEPIFTPRVAHYGVTQLRKQYVSALASLDFVRELIRRVALINRSFSTPILHVQAIPLSHSDLDHSFPIEEPNKFLTNGAQLNLTYLIDDVEILTSAGLEENISPGLKDIIVGANEKFKRIGVNTDSIVMFQISNIFVHPQLDLWQLLIYVGLIQSSNQYYKNQILWMEYEHNNIPYNVIRVFLHDKCKKDYVDFNINYRNGIEK